MPRRADIAITVGGTAVGRLRQASVDVAFATLPAAAEDAYGFVRAVPGALSWSASGSTFVPAAPDGGQEALRAALVARLPVVVVVAFGDGTTETGTAFVTSWDVAGSVGSAVEGSFSLRGTGALTPA